VMAARLLPAAWWRQQCQRFDALAGRERLLVIVAATAAAVMLADALWLSPAFKAWSAAHKREQSLPALVAKTAADAQRAAAEALTQQRQLQAELDQLRRRLQDGDAAMREIEANLVGPDRMLALLEQMLDSHGRLRVREMKSLPRTDLAGEPAAAPSTAAASAAMAAPRTDRPALYRHGIELTLEGSFADLVGYLGALENMPQRLLWGAMRLHVEQHPKAVLTLRVYTLSLDRHWLEI